VIDAVDLHLHSYFSIATSKRMNLVNISYYSKLKGISIVGTGDILFPPWRYEIEKELESNDKGFYLYKDIRFVLTSEINLIFETNCKLRKVHLILTFSSLESVRKCSNMLKRYGNLESASRPNIFLDGTEIVRILKEINDDIQVIPAHIFTPWFGLFGSKSGFDSIEMCFGKYYERISAFETGLSADPSMCNMINSLIKLTPISNSDAHSPEHIGREATLFKDIISYDDLFSSIKNPVSGKFLFTLEYFPEEGKYFADGHRKCNYYVIPRDTNRTSCPVCGKPLTYGVYHRILELSEKIDQKKKSKLKYIHMLALKEIISKALHKGRNSIAVEKEYRKALDIFKNEINVLCFVDLSDLINALAYEVAVEIIKIREEKVSIVPGFDGKYGEITIN
jgi:uncharacterized protein (TIGR00375 family)